MDSFICNIWKVEHGSAAFIKTPNNKIILLDAGASDSFSPTRHLYEKHALRKINLLVISHPHKDHIRDLPFIKLNFIVDYVLWNKNTPQELIFPDGIMNIQEPHKSFYDLINSLEYRPEKIDFGNGVNVYSYCLNKQYLVSDKLNLNNYSLVLCVKYKNLLIVFPGDLEPAGWSSLLKISSLGDLLREYFLYKILIAPHHGRRSGVRFSDGSIFSEHLELMTPNLVIISDKWGSETTDPEAYRPYCKGMCVFNNSNQYYPMKVITTKTHDCVSIVMKKDFINVRVY